MTLTKFREYVNTTARQPGIRNGQLASSLLWKVRPDLFNKIVGTEYDPFYVDSRLPKFWEKLEELWNES